MLWISRLQGSGLWRRNSLVVVKNVKLSALLVGRPRKLALKKLDGMARIDMQTLVIAWVIFLIFSKIVLVTRLDAENWRKSGWLLKRPAEPRRMSVCFPSMTLSTVSSMIERKKRGSKKKRGPLLPKSLVCIIFWFLIVCPVLILFLSLSALETVIEELRKQNADLLEQLRLLFDCKFSRLTPAVAFLILSSAWRTDCAKQHNETLEAVNATANERIPFNVKSVRFFVKGPDSSPPDMLL
jgi:hypothetical protein